MKYWCGISDKDQRYQALEYGSAVHETLEYYFKNKQEDKYIELAEIGEYFDDRMIEHDIPFESKEEETTAYQQGVNMLERLVNKSTELDKLLNSCKVIGVEKDFVIPIESGVTIGDEFFDTVYIVGYIDLILQDSDGELIIIDHKSGKKKFDSKKLKTNLQFPIYALYCLQEYGKLPKKCLYNFTRLGVSQEVFVDDERIKESLIQIKQGFRQMYKSAKYKGNPSPLCYWCDFGHRGLDICGHCSDWKPKRKE